MNGRIARLLVFVCVTLVVSWSAPPKVLARASARMSAEGEQRRAERERTYETLAVLNLPPGAVAADIGARTGFHTLPRGQAAAEANQPPAGSEPARDQVRALASADVARITPAELAALQARGPVVLLDVRDEAMFARGRIPGARLATMSALRDVVAEVRGSDVPIVAYCSCPQEESSGRAVLYLEKHGVTGGRALLGGYDAWVSERRPVESGR